MTRSATLLLAVLGIVVGLGGCIEKGPMRGGFYSLSYQLRVDMTLEDVQQIMGRPPSHVSVAPQNALFLCRIYPYDKVLSAKFVHVTFEDNFVISASYGHRKVCKLWA